MSKPGAEHWSGAGGDRPRGPLLAGQHPLPLEHTRDWTLRELGIAVHAETVRIHPFSDGNGRTTRLLADLVFAAAQEGDTIYEYDWDLDKREYIALLRAYDVSRDPQAPGGFRKGASAGLVIVDPCRTGGRRSGVPVKKAGLSRVSGRRSIRGMSVRCRWPRKVMSRLGGGGLRAAWFAATWVPVPCGTE